MTAIYEVIGTINPPADAMCRAFTCPVCQRTIGDGMIAVVWDDATESSAVAHPAHFEQATEHQLIKRLNSRLTLVGS